MDTKKGRGEDYTLKDYHLEVINTNHFPSTRELFRYLDAKRREKKIRITEVINDLGCTRTTYYRNLKDFKSQSGLPSYNTCYKLAKKLGYKIMITTDDKAQEDI